MFYPKSKIRFLLLILVISFSFSCSSTESKRNVKEVISDAAISNKIKFKLIKDKQTSGFKINVDTWKRVVILKGEVKDQSQIDRAIEISEKQKGVREVKSFLVIKDTSEIKENDLLDHQGANDLEKKKEDKRIEIENDDQQDLNAPSEIY